MDHTRQRLIENISKEGHQDGMDGILICFDKTNNKVTYSAGHNNPVLINKNGLNILPADKMPIGKSDKTQTFSTHEIQFEKDDMLFLPTDGYSDQFGGTGLKPAGKKFKRSNLNQLFADISKNSVKDQQTKLENILSDWKGEFEQVDDITIVGIKL
ncbi:MAG: SpoIIE family protein phosphatase [Crocinitomicaceae bacterium]|nr:SpoIIE family protein phosphatase [Crocinitomicaceae bacterium]